MTIDINDRTIGGDARPFIVAEAGVNFRDDIELGKAFVREASAAGADAVKFQTHVQSAEMVESEMRDLGHGELFERMGTYSLSAAEHEELSDCCRENDVIFLSTPFSVAAVDLLEDLGVAAYKVGSGELTNHHLLRRIAETGKPMVASTGMHSMEDVRAAHDLLVDNASGHVFLYCVSEYPTDPEDFNLGTIARMSEEFGVPVGFSDHSIGVEAATIAMARGAALVEKHFTIDRRLPGGDQDVSIEPEELADLRAAAELAAATRGDSKTVSDSESELATWAGHSIVTASDITAGEEFTEANLTTKRPGTGIPASEFFAVLGREAARELLADTVVREGDLA